MGTYLINAITIQRAEIGESDVLVTAYSRERGKVRFVVRGTKKPASSLRGAVEPLTEGRFFLVERTGTDLLSEWEPAEYNFEMKKDIGKLALAQYLGRMIIEFSGEGIKDNKLYIFLKNIIFILYSKYPDDIIKLVIEWGFLTVSGLAPDFGVCVVCGRFDNAQGYLWEINEGDFYCDGCAAGTGAHYVKLGRDEVALGRKIEAAARLLIDNQYESAGDAARGMSHFAFGESGAIRGSATLSRGLSGFCRYHLREDVPEWRVKLNAGTRAAGR